MRESREMNAPGQEAERPVRPPAGWRLASLSSGPKGSTSNNVRGGMFRPKEKGAVR